jgi:HK97 family phage major capsid protein
MLEQTKVRLERLLDERAQNNNLQESVVQTVNESENNGPDEVQTKMLANYRQRAAEIDEEVEQLREALEREKASEKASKLARTFLAGAEAGIEIGDNGETQYREFAEYARDVMITKYDQIAALAGGEQARQAAAERKNRAPVNTLSSNLAGLQPPQYLAQIMDVIDKSRPIVATANSVSLQRGQITYPRIVQRPTVTLQSTEKTEGGTANMQVELVTMNASTYIGGGNISWQAVQWSSPDALSLWFNLAGEAYAVQTETKAASVLGSAGAAGGTATTLISGSSTFDNVMAAIVSGAKTVYANSRAAPDTLWVSPDVFYYIAGLTSANSAKLVSEGTLSLGGQSGTIAGVRVVMSPGLTTGKAYIGDSRAFIVAENAGAPVELRVVEPAIGGYEVGVIGAFAAAGFANNRFAKVGTG